jgi:hypothetical protein
VDLASSGLLRRRFGRWHEEGIRGATFLCALLSVLVTAGIILVLSTEAATFFREVPVVRKMVRAAGLARTVGGMDDEVDDIHRMMFTEMQDRMLEDPELTERAVAFLSASKDFERVADLATNIAEDVIFMVEGEVVRHRESERSTL